MPKFKLLCAPVVAIAVLAASGLADVKMESPGTPRRARQDEMQLKDPPSGLWSKVSDWSDGKGVTPEQMSGKPVLVMTWSGWYRAGDSAARIAQSAADKYAGQGLVVVGVHNARGFDQAKANAERLGIKFPYANDPKGEFRDALLLDQDPDFVVIDRAGHLRYIDIETGSVDEAVREVVTETQEQAQNKPQEVAAAAAKAKADALRTRNVTGLAPGQTVSVEFELPEKEAYEKVKWPYRVKGEGKYEFDKFSDKLIHEPPSIHIPEEESNYKPFFPQTKGKLTVLYFVDPKRRSTLNILPTMNNLQELYKRDAAMVCVTAKFGIEAFGINAEDAAKLVERNGPLVSEILRTRNMNHPIMENLNGLTAEKLKNLEIYGTSWEDAAVCLILSTDGTVRWIGHPAEGQFKTQMDELIRVDPGVQARRKAEDAKLGKR
jgi:hypothetical protein